MSVLIPGQQAYPAHRPTRAYQQLGLAPAVAAFGEKTQVRGVMAGVRADDVNRAIRTSP